MDHLEFRDRRRRLGLTQPALAALLGLDARTLRRYEQDPAEAGASAPHPAACAALRWLCDGRLPDLPAPARRGRPPGGHAGTA